MSAFALLRSLVERHLVRDVSVDLANGTITFHRWDSLKELRDTIREASIMMHAIAEALQKEGIQCRELDTGRINDAPYTVWSIGMPVTAEVSRVA